MDEQAFDILMKHLDRQDAEIAEIKKDVRTILEFRWQIIGGSAVLSFITATIISLLTIYFTRR